MSDKYKKISNKDLTDFEKYHKLKIYDWYNNQFHLSGFSGLVNDPNGLVYFQGVYYIFMQNCPFSPEHQNKSWSLYTTRDFINYKYHGIVLTPSIKEDAFGVFSGSAFVWDNKLRFYYTGNIKYLENNTRSSYTIQAEFDFEKQIGIKKVLFKTDEKKFTGHFRDPVIHYNNNDNKFYMINGAQNLLEEGVIAIHETNSLEQPFEFKNIIKLDIFDNYMIECPNFFSIGDKKVLMVSPERNISFKDGSHKVYYQIGDFDKDYKKFKGITNWQELDGGYDFYAPQVFNNSDRNLLIGWNGNSSSEQKITYENMWSNNLTIVRELKLKDNKIIQTPVEEIKKLRIAPLKSFDNQVEYQNGLLEMLFENNNQDFEFEILNSNEEKIIFQYQNQVLKIDRSRCTKTDEESLPNKIILKQKISSMQLLVDRSSIEAFINNGENVISLRFYLMNHEFVKFKNLNPVFYQLKGYEIDYQNIVWKNQEIK
ncbi:glycoside hydrolase family 32 protein [Spiroplasma alleghenense]|uniref:beta-fructofuranosidase n=1 Tax=Spiroplasma alleghenense TaxID=216931 RepID=A0A345Z5A6_9MOLU|nr:glycoside hydrolase family 32 protein [Spiroplasma alleghenense]AXK51785.1 beta-fructofuranosidase [Spiroplasma alleghenense]